MAKVIKVFRERRHGMKRYEIGDEYPNDDMNRVRYLEKLGYVELSEEPVKSKKRKKGADQNGDTDAGGD